MGKGLTPSQKLASKWMLSSEWSLTMNIGTHSITSGNIGSIIWTHKAHILSEFSVHMSRPLLDEDRHKPGHFVKYGLWVILGQLSLRQLVLRYLLYSCYSWPSPFSLKPYEAAKVFIIHRKFESNRSRHTGETGSDANICGSTSYCTQDNNLRSRSAASICVPKSKHEAKCTSAHRRLTTLNPLEATMAGKNRTGWCLGTETSAEWQSAQKAVSSKQLSCNPFPSQLCAWWE